MSTPQKTRPANTGPPKLAAVFARFGEASSLSAVAAALWGATAMAPPWLAGAFGLDVTDWRAIVALGAVAVTLTAIMRREGGQS